MLSLCRTAVKAPRKGLSPKKLTRKYEYSGGEPKFTHLNPASNRPMMVDVNQKEIMTRKAVAQAIVRINDDLEALLDGKDLDTPKGPVFATAVISGTMAAKKTSDLIPMCHPLRLTNCKIDISTRRNSEGPYVKILATVKARERTGVELEALTAASIAALTVVDMCKSVVSPFDLQIRAVELLEKHKYSEDPDVAPLVTSKESEW